MARTDRRGKGTANQSGQTSFTGGEISPRTQGRLDHDLYGVSLKEALNTVIHPQGPISSRAGMEFVENLTTPTVPATSDYAMFSFEGPIGDTYTIVFRPAENYGSRAIFIRHIDGQSLLVHQPWAFDMDELHSPQLDDQTHVAQGITAANPGVVTMSMPFFPSDNSYVYTKKTSGGSAHELLEDGRLKCAVIAKSGTSSTAVSASTAWRLFPLEIPVAAQDDFTADLGYSSNVNGSGYVLGTYFRVVPTDGNIANVPVAFRWLTNGYYFCDSKQTATGAGRIRMRRMGILGPQAPQKTSTNNDFDTADYANGDAGLVDASFMESEFAAGTYPEFTPTATSLNLSFQPLEESKFTLTGSDTSEGGASAPAENTVEVYRASEVFVPIPVSELKTAHAAQNITSLIFTGETFPPFELFFSQYPTMCSGGDEPVYDVTDTAYNTLTRQVVGRYGLDLGIAGHFEYYPFLTERHSIETYTPHLQANVETSRFYPVNYPHYVRAPAQLTQYIATDHNDGDDLQFVFYVTGTDRNTDVESFSARIDCAQDALMGSDSDEWVELRFWLNGVNQNAYKIYMYEGDTLRMLYVTGTDPPDAAQSIRAINEVSLRESYPWGVIDDTLANAAFATLGPNQVRNHFVGEGNYPACVSFSGQRLAFAGSINSPESIWLSAIDDFSNFTATDAFDELKRPLVDQIRQDTAIKAAGTSQSVSRVLGLAAMQELLAFTRKSENRIGAGDFASLTPTTVGVYPQSGYGSAGVQPIQAEDSAIYVTQSGSAVRDIQYAADGLAGAAYGGKDLSILVRHLFEGRTVVDWAYAKPPQSLLYIVLDNGTILTATYNPEHEIVAWSKYVTDGKVVAVSSAPDQRMGSVVHAVVERFAAGNTIATVEQFSPSAEYNDTQRQISLDASVSILNDLGWTDEFFVDLILHWPLSFLTAAGEIWIKVQPFTAGGARARLRLKPGNSVRISGFTAATGGLLVPASGDTINGDWYIDWVQAEGATFGEYLRLYTATTVDPASDKLIVTPAPSATTSTTFTDPDIHFLKTAGAVDTFNVPHLANRTVTLIKNDVISSVDVPATGIVALGGAVFDATIGIPYETRIRTLPFADFRRGTIKGNPKRVSRVTLSLLDSRGAQVGMGDGPLVDIKDPLDESGLDAGRLRSGDRNVSIRGTYDYYGEVLISQTQPYPLTVLGIFSEMNVGDL